MIDNTDTLRKGFWASVVTHCIRSSTSASVPKKRLKRGLGRHGFSLIEILMVMAIMAILAAVALPATGALQGAGQLDQATSDISSTLESARAYAMGNNTFVYVGLQEVSGVSPGANDGTGRIVMATIASKDGTRPDISLWGTAGLAAAVVNIDKPEAFQNVHLATANLLENGAKMTSRPSGSAVTDLGSIQASSTTFQWPLAGSARNTFSKVIEFDPQGVPRIQTGTTYDSAVSSYIEVPLLTAHGTHVATTATQVANQSAIQLDGVTGAVRIYRP